MGDNCIVLPEIEQRNKQDDSDHQPIIGVVMNMYVYEFSSEKQRLNRKALVILLGWLTFIIIITITIQLISPSIYSPKPFRQKGHTTLLGTTSPTLCNQRVGSLTSLKVILDKGCETGPMIYRPNTWERVVYLNILERAYQNFLTTIECCEVQQINHIKNMQSLLKDCFRLSDRSVQVVTLVKQNIIHPLKKADFKQRCLYSILTVVKCLLLLKRISLIVSRHLICMGWIPIRARWVIWR